MKGRKPKPTALVALHGKTSNSRVSNPAEPEAPGRLSDDLPPEWLSPTQKEAWNYAIENAPAGLLRKIDRELLAVWVVAVEAHREAAEGLQTTGIMVKVPGQPAPIESPFLRIARRQAALIAKLVSELGFSPVSRTRAYANLAVPLEFGKTGNPKAAPPLEAFLATRPPIPALPSPKRSKAA